MQVPWELPHPPADRGWPYVIVSVSRTDSELEAATSEFTTFYTPYNPAALLQPVHQDWTGFVSDDSPALPGEILHIYTSGLGPVDCPIRTGEPAPLDRLCHTVRPIEWDYWWTATDSVPAEVLFSGLAPGLLGVYQIEVRVPTSPPSARLKLIADRVGWYVAADFAVRQ